MQLQIEQLETASVVVVPGTTLDANNANDFKAAMLPLFTEHGEVILDLSKLKFVDSSGLGAMLSCLRQLSAKSGDLKLCGMSKQVRALFELVRMHRIFDIYGTKEEAARAFSS